MQQDLEHQDGITQATPIACKFLAAIAKSGVCLAQEDLCRMLASFHKAAEFSLSVIYEGVEFSPLTFDELTQEARLWRPEMLDEMDSEVYDNFDRVSLQEILSWNFYTSEQTRSIPPRSEYQS